MINRWTYRTHAPRGGPEYGRSQDGCAKFQKDDGVRAKAKQNTKDHFVSAHEKVVQHAVAGQQAQHAQFFKQFFRQPDFETEFTRLLLGLVYDDFKDDGEAA